MFINFFSGESKLIRFFLEW